MTVENISWSISTKECCWSQWGLNPWPPGLQSDGASNWATEAGSLFCNYCNNERILTKSKWDKPISIIITAKNILMAFGGHWGKTNALTNVTWNKNMSRYWTSLYLPIIPTPQTYTCLAQFDWLRAIWKWYLYHKKSTEQESRNYFLCTKF